MFFNWYNENISLNQPALRFAENNESGFRSAKSRTIKVITSFQEVLVVNGETFYAKNITNYNRAWILHLKTWIHKATITSKLQNNILQLLQGNS